MMEELLAMHDGVITEDLLNELDITPLEVLLILYKHGYIEIPEYVRRHTNEEQEESEA